MHIQPPPYFDRQLSHGRAVPHPTFTAVIAYKLVIICKLLHLLMIRRTSVAVLQVSGAVPFHRTLLTARPWLLFPLGWYFTIKRGSNLSVCLSLYIASVLITSFPLILRLGFFNWHVWVVFHTKPTTKGGFLPCTGLADRFVQPLPGVFTARCGLNL